MSIKEWLLGGLVVVSFSIVAIKPQFNIGTFVLFGGSEPKQMATPAPEKKTGEPVIVREKCPPFIPRGTWTLEGPIFPEAFHTYDDDSICVRWGVQFGYLRHQTADASKTQICLHSYGDAWRPIWCTRKGRQDMERGFVSTSGLFREPQTPD